MTPSGKKHPLLTALVVALLAAACICGVELAFCRVADPQKYDQITAPAISFAHDLRDWAGRQAASLTRQAASLARRAGDLAQRLAALIPEKEELPEEPQVTSDTPAIVEELIPADPTITELRREDGREVLTGGSVPLVYYNQKDDAWAEERYGSDPIGKYGCGPTALAMLVSSLTEEDVDPVEMAAWAAGAGYCARRSGSYLSIVEGAAEHFGLECTSLPVTDAEDLLTGLSTGGIAVALMGPGHFTKGGHFILLHGDTLTGNILAADPNSRENSLVEWDPQVILDELSASRSNGAPLWLLSVPAALQ